MLIQIKDLIRNQLGIPPAMALLIAGAVLHLATNLLLRRRLTSIAGLCVTAVIAVSIEAGEIVIAYRDVGIFTPGADPLYVIVGRHMVDVILMLAIPGMLVISGWRTRNEREP